MRGLDESLTIIQQLRTITSMKLTVIIQENARSLKRLLQHRISRNRISMNIFSGLHSRRYPQYYIVRSNIRCQRPRRLTK